MFNRSILVILCTVILLGVVNACSTTPAPAIDFPDGKNKQPINSIQSK